MVTLMEVEELAHCRLLHSLTRIPDGEKELSNVSPFTAPLAVSVM